ncbi:MAG: ABC transporter permease [Bacteroidia bacterium]|nr:ABC transporter permease [Bacteroidia bacterium]
MLKNYFTIAIRNFWKQKIFSLINVSGLAIGISAALVIYLLVQFEFSFEKFRKDNDRIYRVTTDRTLPGESVIKNSGVPMPVPEAVRTDLAGIETATHFVTTYTTNVSVPAAGSQSPAEFKNQKDIIYADEYYFSIFESDWVAGSKQTALKDPYQLVLTEERAKTYFGNLPANEIIGRRITYDDSITTTVAGIIKDQTEKATDFRFKEFISLATVMSTGLKDRFGGDDWGNISSVSQLFIKLKKGARPEQFDAQLVALREKYRDKKEQAKDDAKHNLQSLNSIHFNTNYGSFDNGRQAHKPTLYGLLAVCFVPFVIGVYKLH